jgi:hypothetical protein
MRTMKSCKIRKTKTLRRKHRGGNPAIKSKKRSIKKKSSIGKNDLPRKHRSVDPDTMLNGELLDWIDVKKLQFEYLVKNPNAIKLLQNNPYFKNLVETGHDWNFLSQNPNAMDLIDKYPNY